MNSLKALLISVADSTLSKAGKTILKGLGLGVISSSIVLVLFNQLVSYAQAEWGKMGADVLMILALANIDYGLSIIIGCCVLKITMMVNKVAIGKM